MALERLKQIWSTSGFSEPDRAAYAERLMTGETRDGVRAMSLVLLVPLLLGILLHDQLGLERNDLYTSAALAVLCTHVFLASRAINETRTLHLLAMALLAVSGTAFVLVAHRAGAFGVALFSSVALLFMVIPMVPWGLREATTITAIVYGTFSLSTLAAAHRFESEGLWTLQAFMFAAGGVSLTLAGRGARVRKDDISARYELEAAHREAERCSLQDPLTGAWNRRFLELEFHGCAERARKEGREFHLAVVDLNRFKQINDNFGHAAGDQALCWVARGLQRSLGDAGHVIRAGGDEFALLLETDDPEIALSDAVDAIRSLAAEGDDAVPAVSMSIGIATVPPQLVPSLDEVYRHADTSLYAAKRLRREHDDCPVVRAAMHALGGESPPSEGRTG